MVFLVVLPFMQYIDAAYVHLPLFTTSRLLLLGALVYLVFGRGFFNSREVRRLLPPVYFFAILLLWSSALGSSFTPNVGNAMDVVVLPVLVFALLWRAGLTERQSDTIGRIGFAVLAFEVFAGVNEFLSGTYFFTYPETKYVLSYSVVENQPVGVRATGTFAHPEEYALVCGLLGLWLFRYWRNRGRPVLAFSSATLGLAGCVLSGLRGVLIPLVLIMLWSHVHRGRHFARRFITTTMLVAGGAIFIDSTLHPFTNPVVQDRLSNGDNIYARVAAYKSAFSMFLDHPIVGIGYGRYTEVASQPKYAFEQFHGVFAVPFPHNSFLAVLAESGVIGIILFAWLWVVIFRITRGSRSARELLWFFLLAGLSLNLAGEALSVAATLVIAAGAMATERPAEQPRRVRRLRVRYGAPRAPSRPGVLAQRASRG